MAEEPEKPNPAEPAPEESRENGKPSLAQNLLFSILTLLLIFFIIEGTWRLVCRITGSLPPTADRSLAREWEWVRPFLTGERTELANVWMTYDPKLGWCLRPGWVGREERNGASIHINSLGLRSTRETTLEKGGRPRLLCLGDSFTFGVMVDDESSYPEILGTKYLTDWEVLNAGVPGYGIDQMVLYYEDRGHRFQADVVMLGFFIPDINRNLHWFYVGTKPRFDLVGDRLVLSRDHVRSATEIIREYSTGERKIRGSGSYLLTELRWKLGKIKKHLKRVSEYDWRLTEKLLERFHEDVVSHGSTPFLLIIPHYEILKQDSGTRSDEVGEKLAAKAKELEMPFLNLAPVLREKAKRDPGADLYPRELTKHFSPEAADIVARRIAESLREWGLAKPTETAEASPSVESEVEP